MAVTVRFHDDPRTVEGVPCVDDECDAEHVEVEVRGVASVERFACEHLTAVVVWHPLTLSDHPEPACVKGCTMTREVVG